MDNQESCPVGPGGNHQLTNQDEQLILDRTTQGLTVETEGMQDSGPH